KRLKELDNPKLSPAQRASLGEHFYRAEMMHPTPHAKPPSTDPMSHDYVLAQITRKLVRCGAETAALKQGWERAHPGEVKDCLLCFLGLKGDKDTREPLGQLVANAKEPLWLRELGVEALGELAVQREDVSAGDALARALREDAQGVYAPLSPAA